MMKDLSTLFQAWTMSRLESMTLTNSYLQDFCSNLGASAINRISLFNLHISPYQWENEGLFLKKLKFTVPTDLPHFIQMF